MILHDVSLYGREGFSQLWLHQGNIAAIAHAAQELPSGANGPHINLDGALVLPGFINSHDHLDFNLFPQLGDGIYQNYRDWGPRIQREHAAIIEKIKSIPLSLRIAWGQYRNILHGFTT